MQLEKGKTIGFAKLWDPRRGGLEANTQTLCEFEGQGGEGCVNSGVSKGIRRHKVAKIPGREIRLHFLRGYPHRKVSRRFGLISTSSWAVERLQRPIRPLENKKGPSNHSEGRR